MSEKIINIVVGGEGYSIFKGYPGGDLKVIRNVG